MGTDSPILHVGSGGGGGAVFKLSPGRGSTSKPNPSHDRQKTSRVETLWKFGLCLEILHNVTDLHFAGCGSNNLFPYIHQLIPIVINQPQHNTSLTLTMLSLTHSD